jgi:hypothetical protein
VKVRSIQANERDVKFLNDKASLTSAAANFSVRQSAGKACGASHLDGNEH